MKHKAMLLLKYKKDEWKSLGLWTRFKLRMFAICWKEILQIEVKDEDMQILRKKV